MALAEEDLKVAEENMLKEKDLQHSHRVTGKNTKWTHWEGKRARSKRDGEKTMLLIPQLKPGAEPLHAFNSSRDRQIFEILRPFCSA